LGRVQAEANHKSVHPVKHAIMLQLWRLGQVYQPVTMALLSITAAGVIYEHVHWRLFDNLYLDMGVILGAIYLISSLAGYGYDKVLRMWNEGIIVSTRRSPYTRAKLTPKHAVLYSRFLVPLLRAAGQEEDARFFENWVRAEREADPELDEDLRTITELMEAG
jgi:hypothetical protein